MAVCSAPPSSGRPGTSVPLLPGGGDAARQDAVVLEPPERVGVEAEQLPEHRVIVLPAVARVAADTGVGVGELPRRARDPNRPSAAIADGRDHAALLRPLRLAQLARR